MQLSRVCTQTIKHLGSAKLGRSSTANVSNNIIESSVTGIGAIARGFEKTLQKPSLCKRILNTMGNKMNNSSLNINYEFVSELLKSKKYSMSEIMELVRMLPKNIKRNANHILIKDIQSGCNRYLTPQELMKLVKSHPDVDGQALSRLFQLNSSNPEYCMTLKEIDKLLNNKNLVNKLKEETNCLINKSNNNVITGISNNRVPRYIYHLTSKSAYEQMLATGQIKMSQDVNFQGVFGIELTNFFKRWCSSDLATKLMHQVSKGSKDVVLLKIPTQSLNKENLFIRSQNRYFKEYKSLDDIYVHAKKEGKDVGISLLNWLNKYEGQGYVQHIQGETSATLASKFKQNKEAIEYIYKDTIPMNMVQKVGETTVDTTSMNIKELFMSLLKDAPEIKGAELLKEINMLA